MTIAEQSPINRHLGDGLNDTFVYTFTILTDNDLVVFLDGTELTQGNQYSLQNQTDVGGEVLFLNAPGLDAEIVIKRETSQDQEVVYTPFDPFPAKSHEGALDKLTMLVQESFGRAQFGLPLSDDGTFWDGEGLRIHNVLSPIDDDQVATKRYVDIQTGDPAPGSWDPDSDWSTTGNWFNNGNWDFTGDLTYNGSQVAIDDDIPNISGLAEKSVELISTDTEVLTIGTPTLADDVDFTIRTQVANGLAKLNTAGKIPSEILDASGLEFLGVRDPADGLPVDATAGQFYVFVESGNISLLDSDGNPQLTDVVPGDTMLWSDSPVSGFYFVARVIDTLSADLVSYDNSLVAADRQLAASNAQAAIDALASEYARVTADEEIAGGWNFVGAVPQHLAVDLATVAQIPDVSNFTEADQNENITGQWAFGVGITLVGSAWPSSIGDAGQVVVSDGLGQLNWENQTGGSGGGLDPSEDAFITGDWEWLVPLRLANSVSIQAREVSDTLRDILVINNFDAVGVGTISLPLTVRSNNNPAWNDGGVTALFAFKDINQNITGSWTFLAQVNVDAPMLWSTAPRLNNNVALNALDSGGGSNRAIARLAVSDVLVFGDSGIDSQQEVLASYVFNVSNLESARVVDRVAGSFLITDVTGAQSRVPGEAFDELISGLWTFNGIPNFLGASGGSALTVSNNSFLSLKDTGNSNVPSFYMDTFENIQLGNPGNILNIRSTDLRLDGNLINDDSGLIQLTEAGKVPASLLPFTALEFQGTFDASPGDNPADGTDSGEFYVINVAGTLTIFTEDNGVPVATNVEPGDYLLWINSPNVQVSGWYYITREAPVFIDSDNVTYDPTAARWVETTVQDVLDEISDRAALLAESEIITSPWTFGQQTTFQDNIIGQGEIQLLPTAGTAIIRFTGQGSPQTANIHQDTGGSFIFRPDGSIFTDDFLWTAALGWHFNQSLLLQDGLVADGVVTFNGSSQINATMFWNVAPRLANNIGLNSIDVGSSANINMIKMTSVDTIHIGESTITQAIELLTNTLFHSCNSYANAAVFSRFTTDGPTGQGLRIISDSGRTTIRGFSDPNNAKVLVIDAGTNEANDVNTGGENTVALQTRGITKLDVTPSQVLASVPIRLDNSIELQAQDFGGTTRSLATVDASSIATFGGTSIQTRIKSGGNIFFETGGVVESGRAGSLADGGLLVRDRLAIEKKVGFRNPGFNGQSDDYAFVQSDEGQVVRKGTGVDVTITVNSLEAGTSIIFINRTTSDCTFVEGTIGDLRAIQGGNVINGGFTLARNSLVQLWWQSTANCECWGNGISEL